MGTQDTHFFGIPTNHVGDENGEYVVASAGELTIYFNDSGTDNSDSKFLGLGHRPSKVLIRSDQTFMITERNGIAFKSPISIPEKLSQQDAVADTDTAATFRMTGGVMWDYIKIRTLAANQTIKVYING